MISQTAPRKSLHGLLIPEEKGFFIDGADYADCIRQLKEYGRAHPEKWIYVYNCGIGPGDPIPVARHLIEVHIYNAEPAALMVFSQLFQEGCDGKHEIDEMTLEERNELRKKQESSFDMLGSINPGKEPTNE